MHASFYNCILFSSLLMRSGEFFKTQIHKKYTILLSVRPKFGKSINFPAEAQSRENKPEAGEDET